MYPSYNSDYWVVFYYYHNVSIYWKCARKSEIYGINKMLMNGKIYLTQFEMFTFLENYSNREWSELIFKLVQILECTCEK